MGGFAYCSYPGSFDAISGRPTRCCRVKATTPRESWIEAPCEAVRCASRRCKVWWRWRGRVVIFVATCLLCFMSGVASKNTLTQFLQFNSCRQSTHGLYYVLLLDVDVLTLCRFTDCTAVCFAV